MGRRSQSGSYRWFLGADIKERVVRNLVVYGGSFSLIYKAGPSDRNMGVYIDERHEVHTYKARSNYPGQLSSGEHTLKLIFVMASSNTNVVGCGDYSLTYYDRITQTEHFIVLRLLHFTYQHLDARLAAQFPF